MCLYPRKMKNRKYLPNAKNLGKVPVMKDPRAEHVYIGCGKCMECMKEKAREWQVRLQEELRGMEKDVDGNSINVYFVSLSFSNEWLDQLEKDIDFKHKIDCANSVLIRGKHFIKYKPLSGYYLDNRIAKLSVRRFLERWRKKYGKSVKHWFVTELGQTRTERLHIHGFIFTNHDIKTLEKIWMYGNVFIGQYVNERSVNYMVKYVHKLDQKHKYYRPIILTSAGIGQIYTQSWKGRTDVKLNRFRDKETDITYKTRNGVKLPLPTYYKNKIYSEEEKERLWMNMMDDEIMWVDGIKVDVSKGFKDYNRVIKSKRILNEQLGYLGDKIIEEEKEAEIARRDRIKAARQKNK